MKQQLSPGVTAVIVVVVAVVIGFIGWKLAFSPKGINAPPPASASNPNGYVAPPPGVAGGGRR